MWSRCSSALASLRYYDGLGTRWCLSYCTKKPAALASTAPAAISQSPLPSPRRLPRLPPQFVLAAHSVSQMHAVDGGTTYGLPYDSLLPAVREEGKAEMSCVGAVDALHWWLLMCRVGGFQPAHRPLSPRGLFELCLREAEVAADCWRWRNGLPAAAEAAAAGGAAAHSGSGDWSSGAAAATADGVGASGSGGQGTSSHSRDKAASSGRQHGQGKAAFRDHEADTLRQAGLCRTGGGAAPSTASDVGGGSPAATNPPTATLDPSQCPTLAMRAMTCSLALMESSCGAGAGEACAGVSKGTGSGTGGSGGTDRMASPSGNADMGEGAGEAGGGGIDGQGACGGGSGDGMQEAAAHEEADGNGGVGVSGHGDGRAGQGGGAGAGTSSGGCGDAAEETYGSGSGGGNKRPVAWLAKGGPLAQRWWRAAVAAVHCAMDEREAVGSQAVTSCVDRVLDLSLAMPVSDTGGTQHPRTAPTPLVTKHGVHSSCSAGLPWTTRIIKTAVVCTAWCCNAHRWVTAPYKPSGAARDHTWCALRTAHAMYEMECDALHTGTALPNMDVCRTSCAQRAVKTDTARPSSHSDRATVSRRWACTALRLRYISIVPPT